MIMIIADKPRELRFDFATMAKVEAVVNTAEGRRPDERADFPTIINDRKRLSMDRFRILFWGALWGALDDHQRGKMKLSDVDEIYAAYVKAYQPIEEERVGEDGKIYIVSVGAKANLLNKMVEATNNFMGVPSQSREKEEEPKQEDEEMSSPGGRPSGEESGISA